MLLVVSYLAALLLVVQAVAKDKIPDYIDICQRNDPQLEKCILKSVERLRPRLKEGIPELDVPALDPLVLPLVDVSRSSGLPIRALGTNVTVHGAGDFSVTKLRADLKNTKFYVGIKIPFLSFEAQYDVNVRILVLPVKGRGPIRANASDVTGDVVLKGRKVRRDGDVFLEFTDLKLDLDFSNYSVHLENLFNGNRDIADAVNRAINTNQRETMDFLRPIIERVVSSVLLDIANKVTRNFTYGQLFPLN